MALMVRPFDKLRVSGTRGRMSAAKDQILPPDVSGLRMTEGLDSGLDSFRQAHHKRDLVYALRTSFQASMCSNHRGAVPMRR